MLTGFGTDNARSGPLEAGEGGSRKGLDWLSCGEHCAVAVPASGTDREGDDNVGMARRLAARRGHLGGHSMERGVGRTLPITANRLGAISGQRILAFGGQMISSVGLNPPGSDAWLVTVNELAGSHVRLSRPRRP